MKNQVSCNCNTQSSDVKSTEEQIQALGGQIRFLTDQFVEYIDSQPSESSSRSGVQKLTTALERITGGRLVDPGAFPECCLIGNSAGGGFMNTWFCTGTLVHPRIVVTADHCISRVTGQLDPNSIAIGIDSEDDVDNSEIIRISRIIQHPREDLVMLILHTPSTVPPVERASSNDLVAAERVELVGFGNTDPAGSIGFGAKRQVNVPMHVIRKTPGEDLTAQETLLGFNSLSEFVAGRKGSGKDSCKGDSGGPCYIYVDSKRQLAGATSRATDEANDNCGDGGVYVRIDTVADWIDEVIDELN